MLVILQQHELGCDHFKSTSWSTLQAACPSCLYDSSLQAASKHCALTPITPWNSHSLLKCHFSYISDGTFCTHFNDRWCQAGQAYVRKVCGDPHISIPTSSSFEQQPLQSVLASKKLTRSWTAVSWLCPRIIKLIAECHNRANTHRYSYEILLALPAPASCSQAAVATARSASWPVLTHAAAWIKAAPLLV